MLEDLVAAEPVKDLGLKIVHHDSPDRRGVDVSLLYNPRFFKVTGVTNHTLFIDSMPWFKTRDQMCVVGRLGDARHPELGAARIAVIVNHWPSRRGGSRQSSWLREAAAALTKHIADSLTQKYPDIGVIVMGDLNDEPTDKSVRETLGAVRNPQETRPGGFYNPFWRLLDEGIGSYIYRGGWDLFDQIIINSNVLDGKCGVRFQNAKVLNLPFLVQTDGQYKGYPFRTFSGGAWIGGYSDPLPAELPKLFTLLLSLTAVGALAAPTGVKGRLIDAQSGQPVADADVMLRDQGLSVTSGSDGFFQITIATRDRPPAPASAAKTSIPTISYSMMSG